MGDWNSRGASVRRSVTLIAVTVAGLACHSLASAQSDPVIFSFSTVGDSRTDPGKPDATTLLASPNASGGVQSFTGNILLQDNQWVTNTAALGAILGGIQAQNPNLLFFNGDMIFGYGRPILPTNWANGMPNSWTTTETVNPDTVFEISQYAYWRGMVSNLFLTGTYVLPVPGNHETQCNTSAEPYTASPNPNCATATGNPAGVTGPVNGTGKTAYADNENMYRFNMGDLIGDLSTNIRFSDVTGFFPMSPNGLTTKTAPAGDSITSPTVTNLSNGPITGDQHELSYSFDIQVTPSLLVHFAVINTDPSGADSTAPTAWLANDLSTAKSRGASKFFVFGHKAAFTYNYAQSTGGIVLPPSTNTPGPGGLDANYVTNTGTPVTYSEPWRDTFWSVIAQYGATYFCGHEHTVNVAQYADPTGTSTNKPYQVLVGSGGSPFDDKLVTKGTVNGVACSAAAPCEPIPTNKYDRYYAWATVAIHQSGRVSMSVSGFPDVPLSPMLTYSSPQDLTTYDVVNLQ